MGILYGFARLVGSTVVTRVASGSVFLSPPSSLGAQLVAVSVSAYCAARQINTQDVIATWCLRSTALQVAREHKCLSIGQTPGLSI